MQRHLSVALLAVGLLGLSACANDALPKPPDDDHATLVGSLGPGVPPDGEMPARVELVFTGPGNAVVKAEARDGEYQVALPEGTWSVRAADGKACSDDIAVQGGASYRVDLVYPSGECDSAS